MKTVVAYIIAAMAAYTQRRKISLHDKFMRARSNWWRWQRVLFPSPLEVRFAQIMHGRTLALPFIRSAKTGYPLTFIWRGRILKRELVYREVPAGPFFIDYAVVTPFYKRGIELHSKQWHHDIVADQERYDYLKARGWRITYITHKQMKDPRLLFVETLRFLRS